MARVFIRNDTREILFHTQNSAFSATDPRVRGLRNKYPGNWSFLTLHVNVPNNLAIGHYLSRNGQEASTEPYGDVLLARQRKAQFLAKLDEHQDTMRSGALSTIPADLLPLWYKYLRMLTQVSMNDAPFSDAGQWAMVEDSMEHTPYVFEGMTSGQRGLFNGSFADEGEFAFGWWNADRKERSIKPHVPGDLRTDPSNVDYDYRWASMVEVIPADQIDRSDATILPSAQPWANRRETIAAINTRFPWYISSRDASLARIKFTPNYIRAFNAGTLHHSFNVPNAANMMRFTASAASHAATVAMSIGAVTSTNGAISFPLVTGVNTLTVVVTAGTNTKTYTFAITRESP